LLVAPMGLRRPVLDLIRREAASEDGRIIMKVNSLIDPEVVEALYRAAAGGVEVDLIVRSACSLRPGVPGLSESIRVRSLVGHFLEHSRVFRFGSDARGAEYYIGSADMMERNLDRRVEALVPVVDEALRRRLQEILDLDLADEAIAWQLGPDGTWSRVASGGGLDSQRRLQELAIERSRA
jgi:polyphosphate kinase